MPAGNRHGYVAGEIFGELRSHVKANKLGRTNVAETGFKVGSDPDTVLAPDVAFVRRERLGSTRELEGYWSGAPDLVVEVVSLSWLQAGCRMVLVADPKRRITTVYRSREDIRVLTAEAGDLVDGAGVVPGWRLSLADIFAWE